MASSTQKTLEGQYAGFISRFIAFTLDILLANTVVVVVALVAFQLLNFFDPGGYFTVSDNIGGLTKIGQLLFGAVTAGTIIVMNWLYPIVFWMMAGQTPGKLVLGLRVAHMQGSPISLRVALLRLIGYYLSAAALFLGFIWILIDDERRGWHDKLARTCVIYSWEARSSQRLQQTIGKHVAGLSKQ